MNPSQVLTLKYDSNLRFHRSRYLRIFKVLKNWLKYQPIDFFGSGQLMGRLLHFLQLKCDDQSDPEVFPLVLFFQDFPHLLSG